MNDELKEIKKELWADTPKARLDAARDLHKTEGGKAYLEEKQKQLRSCCAGRKWTFGWSTTINPMVMTLGGSPGDFSKKFPPEYIKNFAPPTAGEIHPHIEKYRIRDYQYWQPLINIASRILRREDGVDTLDDVLGLFGNVNLDVDPESENDNIKIKPYLVKCLLKNIHDIFRPRVLVCIGIGDFVDIQENRQGVAGIFEKTFPQMYHSKPKTYLIRPEGKRLNFAEWDVEGAGGSKIKTVTWPNVPWRLGDNMEACCDKFLEENPSDKLFP